MLVIVPGVVHNYVGGEYHAESCKESVCFPMSGSTRGVGSVGFEIDGSIDRAERSSTRS